MKEKLGKLSVIKDKIGPCSFELTKEYFWGQDDESGAFFKFLVKKNSVTLTVGNVNLPINEKEEIGAKFTTFEEYENKCAQIVAKIGSSLPRLIKENKYEPYLVDLSYEFGNSKLVFGSKYAAVLYKRYYDMVTEKFAFYKTYCIIIDSYKKEAEKITANITAFNNKSVLYKKFHKKELAGYISDKMRVVGHIKNCEKTIEPYEKFREEIYRKTLKKYLSAKTNDKMELDVLTLAIPQAFEIVVGPFGFEEATLEEIVESLTKDGNKIPKFEALVQAAKRYNELKQKTA